MPSHMQNQIKGLHESLRTILKSARIPLIPSVHSKVHMQATVCFKSLLANCAGKLPLIRMHCPVMIQFNFSEEVLATSFYRTDPQLNTLVSLHVLFHAPSNLTTQVTELASNRVGFGMRLLFLHSFKSYITLPAPQSIDIVFQTHVFSQLSVLFKDIGAILTAEPSVQLHVLL